jgi:transcriptional regulator with XRE-family HTH domain
MAMVSRMKIERLRKGHTLETLEKSCGVAYYRLWMIENGLLPKQDQMVSIARALDITPNEIFPVFEPEMWQDYMVAM